MKRHAEQQFISALVRFHICMQLRNLIRNSATAKNKLQNATSEVNRLSTSSLKQKFESQCVATAKPRA